MISKRDKKKSSSNLIPQISSFNDTKNNRRLQWGWAQEDLNDFGTVQQGYQGAFALPREIFIQDTPNILHKNSSSETDKLGNARFIKQSNGTWSASTLGVRPAPDVVAGLQRGANHTKLPCNKRACDKSRIEFPKNLSNSYQINLSIKRTDGPAGLTIAASPNREEYTNIYFDPRNNTLGVDRAHSSLIKEFTNYTHAGYFKPYEVLRSGGSARNGSTSRTQTESIDLTIFVDGSLIEVYANDRFALTSRIYPAREDSKGVYLFEGEGVKVEYSHVEIWDGLRNVWPHRPSNSSSLLVFDTPEETGNYTWWTGN